MLRYALLTDGTSDAVLLPILDWLLNTNLGEGNFSGSWVNPERFSFDAKELKDRIRETLEHYPCNVLFIHRDAEKMASNVRYAEIAEAVNDAGTSVPYICVVPVHMTEAWLLFDIQAIRASAGNPNGKVKLKLPGKKEWESLPDPKEKLKQALIEASELTPRRLKGKRISEWVASVPRNVTNQDFSPLRGLNAFNALEDDIKKFVKNFADAYDGAASGTE